MAKTTRASSFRCTECGWCSVKWVGRCGECQTWGSVNEVGGPAARTAAVLSPARRPVPIGDVDVTEAAPRPSGVKEFDRVLGGGLVPGGVILVAGEPGIGKSTLLLDVAARAARAGSSVLYVSGEESAAQVRGRAERIEAMARTLYLAAENDLGTVLGQIEQVSPTLVVIDSVQTLASAEVEGAAGNVAQVREVAGALIALAKRLGIAIILVGHVTKEGSIAGPRILEHLVDVVVAFEGERHSRLRLVRAVKNRFGPIDEVGCFDLSDAGITGLPDPSGLFLSARSEAVPGTCVTAALEGRRPLIAEVQALVTKSSLPTPRRVTHGVDSSRVAMIAAVLEKRAGAPLAGQDVYLSTVGGVTLREPAADLALALAIAGGVMDAPVDPLLVAVGELGLAGEIRPVPGLERRLAEAARLGFTTALVPPGGVNGRATPPDLRVIEVPDLRAAVAHVAVGGAAGSGRSTAGDRTAGSPPAGASPDGAAARRARILAEIAAGEAAVMRAATLRRLSAGAVPAGAARAGAGPAGAGPVRAGPVRGSSARGTSARAAGTAARGPRSPGSPLSVVPSRPSTGREERGGDDRVLPLEAAPPEGDRVVDA